MALPLLAFLGLGAAGKLGYDRYEEAKDKRLAQTYGQLFSNAIGSPPREQAGPQQPGYGGPLMSQGTGLMGGQLTLPEFAGQVSQIPGYQTAAQAYVRDQLQPRPQRNLQIQEFSVGDEKFQHKALGPDGQWIPLDEPYEKGASTEVNIGDDKPSFSDIASLRKEYTNSPETRRFIKLSEAFTKISTAPDIGPGDLGMIFNFMKMLDPDSTVRESEYATAENTGSIPEAIWGAFNKAKSGEKLTESQRANFIYAAAEVFKSQLPLQIKREQNYKDLANSFGVDPEVTVPDIIGDWRAYEWPERPSQNFIPEEAGILNKGAEAVKSGFGMIKDVLGNDGGKDIRTIDGVRWEYKPNPNKPGKFLRRRVE